MRSAGRSGKKEIAREKASGDRLAVVRPEKPEVALRMALEAHRKNDGRFFTDGLPEQAGQYKFVGWLAVGEEGWIVDLEGNVIGRCEPGDSFITLTEENDEKAAAEAVKKEVVG